METDLTTFDWNRTFEALVAIVILAFFIERALALLFEWRHFATRFGTTGLKEPIAFAVALLVTWQWSFDALSMVVVDGEPTFLGEFITAGVIAGGSKASLKLFRDVAGVRNGPVRAGPAPAPDAREPESTP